MNMRAENPVCPPVLHMQAVQKSYGTPQGSAMVLRRVNLNIHEGEFVVITGPSGSGKSTCLHLAALLDMPTAGQVLLDGDDVSRLPDRESCHLRATRIGMVFQKYCLIPHRSVIDNVIFRFRYLEHNPDETMALARHALDIVGIGHLAGRTARLLSGGEMQRVAIARAIALRPRLLIADEPTGNLDHTTTLAVMEHFRRLNNDGITILMVTHNPLLLDYCSRHVSCADGIIDA